MQEKIELVISNQRMKELLMKMILTMYLNKSIVRLYAISKNHLEKVHTILLIQLYITTLVFQSTIS